MAKLHVIYEDNHLLVVNKPAMLPTMGVAAGAPSLFDLAKDYIRRKYDKPGNVYLGIVSRLDAPVTGLVLIARTSKAAARLTAQFKERRVEKTYWAVVSGTVSPTQGELVDYLRKDERHRRVGVVDAHAAGAQEARLAYRALRGENAPRPRMAGLSVLEVNLLTGRKHQIRVQLAHAGHSIVGDRKYGSRRPFPSGIALHARRLVIEHPVRKIPIDFEVGPPDSWASILASF